MLSEADIRGIYQNCRGTLLGLARRGVPCEADAEDVLHRAFLRFLERAPQGMTPHEAERYLARCVTNAVADWWRRLQDSDAMVYEPVADAPGPLAQAERCEEFGRLQKAVAQLPERQRMAITLCYLAHKSRDEAADLMRCKRATVRSLLRQGIKRLREVLSAETRGSRRTET